MNDVHSVIFICRFSLPPQLCSDSLRLCRVSQAELWPRGMWHRVLLPLSAAVAPQPDVWPGPASASPPHLRRQRCLHAVRLQWRTWRRWDSSSCCSFLCLYSKPFVPETICFSVCCFFCMNAYCVDGAHTLTLLLKMQRRSKRALAVVPTSWRPTMAAVTVWTALCVPVSSAGCVCRRSPTCTTSGTKFTLLHITLQTKCPI